MITLNNISLLFFLKSVYTHLINPCEISTLNKHIHSMAARLYIFIKPAPQDQVKRPYNLLKDVCQYNKKCVEN